MTKLEETIAQILTARVLPGSDAATLKPETGLIGSGLALDSIAILELVTGLEEKLDIMIDESTLEPEMFESIATLAAFLSESFEIAD